jgi:hypothetical protein
MPSFYRRERVELKGVGSTDPYTLTFRQIRGCDWRQGAVASARAGLGQHDLLSP